MNKEDFEALSPEEQARIFSKSQIKEKADLLLHSHDPVRLTRSISGEELYLVTREMDVEERSEIIRFASLPQIFFIADIDCWEKDSLSSRGFTRWLETLMTADEEQYLRWALLMDYEALIAGFRKIMFVMKPEWEYAVDEVLGDKPYFTLDYLYYVSVSEESIQTVRRALEIIFENDKQRYFTLLEGVITASEYELEEEAFRKREMRLADRGFPDIETARSVFLPLSRKEYEAFPLKDIQSRDKSHAAQTENRPSYPVVYSKEKIFLDHVLTALQDDPPEVAEGVYEELAWLSNKVIVCKGMDFTDEKIILGGIERARAILNLGLELLAEGDIERARELVKTRWLEALFRHAFWHLAEIREDAQRIVRKYWESSKLELLESLGEPYEYIFRGLLRNVPECYDAKCGSQINYLRDFCFAEDLKKMHLAVRQIRIIHEFLGRQDPAVFALLRSHAEDHPRSFPQLAGTCFAKSVIKAPAMLESLRRADLERFLDKGFEGDHSKRRLRKAVKDTFLSTSFDPQDEKIIRPFWGVIFDNIQGDLGEVDLSEGIDLRYISSLWIANGADNISKSSRGRVSARRSK